MVETIEIPGEAADIIGRIMAEMEEVFGLINRPRAAKVRREPGAEPVAPDDH